ncbi:MAG: hypothetical protein ACJ757_04835 [Gaiellaceae bacterium]
MEWPENVVRGELANLNDLWLGNNRDGFFNASQQLRLMEVGTVPMDHHLGELVRDTATPHPRVESSPLAEVRHEAVPRQGGEMTVASPKKPTKGKSSLASLSKTALRKKLLETVTISDSMWRAYREEHGLPERESGESRETFIRRVLA